MARLVWVHGSGYTRDSFSDQCKAFRGSDAVALPGHPIGAALESVSAYAGWLSEYLQSRYSVPAVVAGNSLGGAIAMRWALDFPDQAAGLILIGTGARLRVADSIFKLIDDEWPECIPSLVDLALSASAPAELRQRAIEWHELVGRVNTRSDYAACNAFDIMQQTAELTLPALIIVGSHDRMTPVKYSQYLHEHIPGSRLAVVADAGHLVMAEKPHDTNVQIREFLERL